MHLCDDVLRLIFLCEKLEIGCRDGTLSPNEAIVIRQCATQLLKAVLEPEPAAH
jgi:hypothetical protein